MTTKMLGSISALVVMQLGRRLAPAWPKCWVVSSMCNGGADMNRSLFFFLTHTYHLAIACQHLMSSSRHSLLVRWVFLKMGVLQNLMVNHHIPYPMDFDGLMRCNSPQRGRCHSTPRR